MRELAALEGKEPKVIINCMSPGACKSDFNREASGFAACVAKIGEAIIARSAEVGSRTLVAGVEAGVESEGGYMEDGVVVK